MWVGPLLIVLACAGALVLFLVKIRNSARHEVQLARTTVVRAEARRDSAVEEAGRERQVTDMAMTQTGQALQVAGVIEQVEQKLDGLTAYLVNRIDGTGPAVEPPGARPVARHRRVALPPGVDPGSLP
jgi:uncharacterized iron-regulated membrane protein